eukprot:m.63641 g.63641  ORF g.63641 m.63641 type:complete len:293 (+) comp23315_c0_seq1:220-1098(+)
MSFMPSLMMNSLGAPSKSTVFGGALGRYIAQRFIKKSTPIQQQTLPCSTFASNQSFSTSFQSQPVLSALSSKRSSGWVQAHYQTRWKCNSYVKSNSVAKETVDTSNCETNDLGDPVQASYIQGQLVENRRMYFYAIDHHGRLFLDDSKRKNFTNAFKDKAFLRFFFSRLRKIRSTDPGFDSYAADFQWVSPCGRELNFIRCDDTPVVYDQLIQDSSDNWELTWAENNFTTPFNPSLLLYSQTSGRLYYPQKIVGYAALASPLTIKIGSSISVCDDGIFLTWQGEQILIDVMD